MFWKVTGCWAKLDCVHSSGSLQGAVFGPTHEFNLFRITNLCTWFRRAPCLPTWRIILQAKTRDGDRSYARTVYPSGDRDSRDAPLVSPSKEKQRARLSPARYRIATLCRRSRS
jgi:hypothetical protein